MKIHRFLFLLLALLLLSGCSDTPYETEASSSQEALSGSPAPIIESYDSYQNMLSKGIGIPEGFITFDRLSVFGQWNHFVFDCLVPSGNHGIWYRYNLKMPAIDGTIEHEICIYHQPEKTFGQSFIKKRTKSKLTNADCENYESMYQIEPRKEKFYIERNGVIYIYITRGELLCLTFELNGIQYYIDVSKPLLNSLDKNSVLARLLSLDEDVAKEAYNEITASLTK